jgi:hypothetical protein
MAAKRYGLEQSGLDSSGLERVADSCERGSGPLGSIKTMLFLAS